MDKQFAILIENGGNISVSRYGKNCVSLRIKFGSKEREFLECLKSSYGGGVYKLKNDWQWILSGSQAESLLEKALPLVSPFRRNELKAKLEEYRSRTILKKGVGRKAKLVPQPNK